MSGIGHRGCPLWHASWYPAAPAAQGCRWGSLWEAGQPLVPLGALRALIPHSLIRNLHLIRICSIFLTLLQHIHLKKVNFCSGIPGPILLHVAIPTDKLLWFCCLRTTLGLIENMSPRVINSPPKSSNKFHCLWEAIGEKIAVGNEIMVCAEKPLLTTNSCVIFASPSPAPRQYCLGI